MDLDHLTAIDEELSPGSVQLVIVPGDMSREFREQVAVHHTAGDDAFLLYVTTAVPSTALLTQFEAAGARTDRVFFVDAATGVSGRGPTAAENRVFVRSSHLTNIAITTLHAARSLPEDAETALVFDNLSTLTIQHSPETVTRFAHSLITKLRNTGVASLFMALDDEPGGELASRVMQFVDGTVRID